MSEDEDCHKGIPFLLWTAHCRPSELTLFMIDSAGEKPRSECSALSSLLVKSKSFQLACATKAAPV